MRSKDVSKLLPSVKPEFFSSPHAWEMEEEKPEEKSKIQETKSELKLKKKSSITPFNKQTQPSSSSASVFDRLGDLPEKSKSVKGIQDVDKFEKKGIFTVKQLSFLTKTNLSSLIMP